MLSAVDHQQFRFILDNAIAEGWIQPEDRIDATLEEGHILVTQTCEGGGTQQRRYVHDTRWHFEFLRDLARGEFRARSG